MDSLSVWLAFGSAMGFIEELPVIVVGIEGAFDNEVGFDFGAIGDTDGDGVSLIRRRGVGGDGVFLFEWDLDWGGRRFFAITFPVEALLRVLVATCLLTFVDTELSIVLEVVAITRSK